MRIAYLTNQYPAPSHTFIRREILAHERAGHHVLRLSIRRYPGQLADEADRVELSRTRLILTGQTFRLFAATFLTALSHPIRFLKALRTTLHMSRTGERGLIVHLVYLLEACLLRRCLKAEKIEHLHAHFGTNPAAVALLCHILGGPSYSFTVHGPDEYDRAPCLSLDTKTRYAAFVVAISHFGQSQLYRWVDSRDANKIRIVRCGLDEAFIQKQLVADLPAVPRFIFVGRLTSTKGIFILAEALKLLKMRGIAPQVALIGDGPERQRLEQILGEQGLAGTVTLLGWKSSDDVRLEILRSHFLILPSFAEGLPVVLMESLALGRPVLTTWIAAIPELVEHGTNGWLMHAGSAEALASTMEKALQSSPELVHQMGSHGRAKVLRLHDVHNEAAKLSRMFEEAVCTR